MRSELLQIFVQEVPVTYRTVPGAYASDEPIEIPRSEYIYQVLNLTDFNTMRPAHHLSLTIKLYSFDLLSWKSFRHMVLQSSSFCLSSCMTAITWWIWIVAGHGKRMFYWLVTPALSFGERWTWIVVGHEKVIFFACGATS